MLSVIRQYQIWLYVAIQEVKNKYKRSVIGPWWQVITLGVTIGCMGPLYGLLFTNPGKDYILYMGIGIMTWSFISSILNSFSELYYTNSSLIKNIRLPFGFYSLKLISREMILFAHVLILLIPLYILYPENLNFNILFFPISLGFLLLFLIGIGLLISIICTRYRDLAPFIANILQLLFFLSPIVWRADSISNKLQIITIINPFYYYIEIIRKPLMGEHPGFTLYLITGIISIISILIGITILKSYKNRIYYWL
jgi:lipopolysaccharide transport system permease protein